MKARPSHTDTKNVDKQRTGVNGLVLCCKLLTFHLKESVIDVFLSFKRHITCTSVRYR